MFFAATSLFFIGCGVEAAKEDNPGSLKINEKKYISEKVAVNTLPNTKIDIKADSPADTVRTFYLKLREQKFQEAMSLTNLRPAIEGLTASELKDLQVDFAALAGVIPADIAINGEIISGDSATVTAELPDNETGKIELQEIRLRRENDSWVILTVDESAEVQIKKEGKNYFFALKIDTHEREAKEMLNRILKAQMVYSIKNKGIYADITTLVAEELLPEDIKMSESTGYGYKITVTTDKKGYTAQAEPAIYGKTGRSSFWFTVSGDKSSSLQSKDLGGKPL